MDALTKMGLLSPLVLGLEQKEGHIPFLIYIGYVDYPKLILKILEGFGF
jgi:hypothetical protein